MTRKDDGREQAWFIASRWQQYEGEARANLLRLIGISVFYAIELLDFHGFRLGPIDLPPVVDQRFHSAMTALAVCWSMIAAGVHVCLTRRVFPGAIKYLSTLGDIALLTTVLAIADGPRSPLVAVYFLVLALATLRFHLDLIRFATATCATGYLILNVQAAWLWEAKRVPSYHAMIVMAALILTGVFLGQVLRRVRTMAEGLSAPAGEA